MNRAIKIALIAIVLLGIVATIVYFINDDTGIGKVDAIAKTDFEKEIEKQVKSDIEGKEYAVASTAFYNVLSEISTEASIVNKDGKKQLSENEVENCKKIAFYAYEPIFEDYQKAYFTHSSWSEKELNALKSRAQNLLGMNIAEGNAKSALSSVVANVNDYYAAWRIVKSAKSCTSVAAVQNIGKQANSYKRSPLLNNASLKAGLESAFSDAKSALANNINARCRKVAQSYQYYDSYTSFYSDYLAMNKLIDEYVMAFGGGSLFANSKGLLSQADDNAMDYFD